ncbi:MAG: hypothetical protein D3923_01750 [Candidatus Electrothrix sp. AR3]|nr:hypothetical protein [Candidatus Electrothrix sp. AR3]
MNTRIVFSIIILCGWYRIGFSELLGSSDLEIQKNFNRLISTKACRGCNLSGAILNRVDLSGVNLEGANLEGAKLNLTNLSGANLRNANLKAAALGGADLAGADLRGANMNGAIVGGAYITDTKLDKGQIKQDEPYKADEEPATKIFSSPEKGLPVEEKTPQEEQAKPTPSTNTSQRQEVLTTDRIPNLFSSPDALSSTGDRRQQEESSMPPPAQAVPLLVPDAQPNRPRAVEKIPVIDTGSLVALDYDPSFWEAVRESINFFLLESTQKEGNTTTNKTAQSLSKKPEIIIQMTPENDTQEAKPIRLLLPQSGIPSIKLGIIMGSAEKYQTRKG